MTQTIRWGILGCGRIARKFASDLGLVQDAKLVAVGSRNLQTAENFANEFDVPHRHNSYEALVQNPEVDVIYVATPHNFHYENTMLCLQHSKAVLCEKAFAVNAAQAKKMIGLAREKNIFLMEALWSKFLPHYGKMQEILQQGLLGEIKSMLVNFGFKPAEPIPARLFDPALAGGTLLDIGIYNVFWAMSILGKPDFIEASMTPATSGIDEQCAVLFRYKNGALAQLFSTFSSNLATEADINGTNGRIRLASRFYEPSTTIEYYTGRVDSKQIIDVQKNEGFGYHYEASHVCECLRNGLTESTVMSHTHTIELIETLDTIRKIAGIHYKEDEEFF